MSKSLPYMPLFMSDFALKTGHLDFEETGVYMRLTALCWITPGCSIPDDKMWIIRHFRIDDSIFNQSVTPILEEFFRIEDGRIFEPDLLSQWGKSKAFHSETITAGKKDKVSNIPKSEIEKTCFDEWNSLADKHNLSKIQILTSARKRNLQARLKECGIDGFRIALAKIEESPFLLGSSQRGWKVGFDFLVKQSGFTKIMEGGFSPNRDNILKFESNVSMISDYAEQLRRDGN